MPAHRHRPGAPHRRGANLALLVACVCATAGCAGGVSSRSPPEIANRVDAPGQASPREFCVRTGAEPDIPVDAAYTVIGQAPRTGALYAGRLATRFDTDHYVLTRTTGEATVAGEAWAVECGPDRVPLLQVRYATTPVETRFLCTLGVNYDNYSLASCGPMSNGNHDDTGLEAWFPEAAGGEPGAARGRDRTAMASHVAAP
jgi:hypothetical protein